VVGETTRRRRRPNSHQGLGSAGPADKPVTVIATTPSLRQTLRYRFDSLLARGPMGVILLLLVATLAFVLLASLIFALAHMHYGGDSSGFGEDFWQSMLRVLDSGTFASDVQWPVRIVALIVTLSGIFIASALIGIISTGFEQRLEALRRGRSLVIEAGHTLILGWSPRVFAIVSELVVANESRRRPAIVILTDGEKAVLEDELDARVPDLRGTRIVLRTGDPSSPQDLERVAVAAARSIVVLADESGDGDAGAVKAALATHSMATNTDVPIVVELASPATAFALVAACGDRVVPVQADDIIAKVAAQACYQAGLGAVYRELLDFDGDEIYETPVAAHAGKAFGDVLIAYERCTLLGIKTADGTLTIAPPMDRLLAADDVLLVVAEDDSLIRTGSHGEMAPAPSSGTTSDGGALATRLLVIGWSDLGHRIVRALDALMGENAHMRILVDPALVPPESLTVAAQRMAIEVVADSGIGDAAIGDYDQVFVLGYRGHLSYSNADARTLLTLVTLNRVLADADERPRIVAEVLESRTVPIAETTGVDDFVVSDELASLLISQLAENPSLAAVFDALFADGGPTIGMVPALHAIAPGDYPWGSVVLALAERGDIALGYRREGDAVVVNPSPAAMVPVAGDVDLVVLSRRPLVA
jgi:voltage-gated potassium channel Kch